MSRVFVVQQPTGRDQATGAIKPTMDLRPAAEYGDLRFILRDDENPFSNLEATAKEVLRVLVDDGFCPEDWLLLVGNPVLIGLVAATAAQVTGSLKLLQWNRAKHAYMPVEVQLSELWDAAEAA